jgi:hypothetical protein
VILYYGTREVKVLLRFQWLVSLLLPFSLLQANQDQSVNWAALLKQTGFFLGVQHGFRLATEPGTRQGMKGPFWRGYYNSLSNLHGWADGDLFYVNYVGHPIQGSASGFIWAQNDGKYRKAEFGNNSFYWKSRLRATAYSWVYSTQFEIGPISEASIGKIQSRYPQQGWVDHVATPVIGLAWQMSEDVLDRYVIRKFEDRFENVFARMMVRSWLNPTRSFANLMRLKEPWYRDTRPGIFRYRRGMAEPYVPAAEVPARELPQFEFTTSTQYTVSPGPRESLHCLGGMGTAQWNFNPKNSWVAEVSGCKMLDQRQNLSGDIMMYMTGPRWTDREGRWMPFGQVLFGGKRITIDEVFPEKRAALEAANPGRPLGYEFHSQWTATNQANGFAVSIGGGLDYNLTRSATLRVASVEYSHAWLPQPEVASYPTSVRLAMGITIKVGNW